VSAPADSSSYVVLRARLGLELHGAAPATVEAAVIDAILGVLDDLGVDADLVQLSPGLDPTWGRAGPPNQANPTAAVNRTGVR
jgi:hypothetical protein